jgi:hypothetical protein
VVALGQARPGREEDLRGASELIRIRLDFLRPFASTSSAEFSFTPDGPRTAVRWSMAGRKNFVSKAIGLVMNMDTMIGGDFEKDLAALVSATETATSARLNGRGQRQRGFRLGWRPRAAAHGPLRRSRSSGCWRCARRRG